MENSNNLALTILKATFLATIIFWIFILTFTYYQEPILEVSIFLVLILSMIPIFLVCAFTIFITITPFFWLAKENVTDKEIFKKYFPYYSIIAFGISSYFIISTNFEGFVCAFFITAFFTLMQSWVWICKIPTNK